jgi:SH3-like domain-containing protein
MNPRRNIIIVFVLLISNVFFSHTALAERLAVASSIANIRSGPGTQYDILWNIEKYHPIDVIEKSGNWYRFRDFEGDEAWIHNSLLDATPTVITIKATCNIRSGPGTNYKTLFTVEKGIPFKVLQEQGNWIQIQHADKDKGWIHKSLVW